MLTRCKKFACNFLCPIKSSDDGKDFKYFSALNRFDDPPWEAKGPFLVLSLLNCCANIDFALLLSAALTSASMSFQALLLQCGGSSSCCCYELPQYWLHKWVKLIALNTCNGALCTFHYAHIPTHTYIRVYECLCLSEVSLRQVRSKVKRNSKSNALSF